MRLGGEENDRTDLGYEGIAARHKKEVEREREVGG